MNAMALEFEVPWAEVALRFAAFSTGADTCIAGTFSRDHLRANVAMVEKGPLPDDMVAAVRDAFRENDDGWTGKI
jgi:aryl-alcohol dehydrogenase-like predicted oxidoreductase